MIPHSFRFLFPLFAFIYASVAIVPVPEHRRPAHISLDCRKICIKRAVAQLFLCAFRISLFLFVLVGESRPTQDIWSLHSLYIAAIDGITKGVEIREDSIIATARAGIFNFGDSWAPARAERGIVANKRKKTEGGNQVVLTRTTRTL